MLLNESFGNLDKLDKSFFTGKIDLKRELSKYCTAYSISPNSNVYVDKLRPIEGDTESRHTWKYLTNVLLNDDSIAFIIIRSNKRQLLLVSGNDKVFTFMSSDSYYLKWSDTAYSLEDVSSNNPQSEIITSNDVSVRNKICKTVEAFIKEHSNAKRSWDIIVVGVDNEQKNKRLEREKSKENMEIKPQHGKNKNDYETSLCIEFIYDFSNCCQNPLQN